MHPKFRPEFLLLLLGLFATQCTFSEPVPPTPAPAALTPPGSLTPDETATLSSLKRVDAYPLFTLHYAGGYSLDPAALGDRPVEAPAWGCSLFAALGGPGQYLTGRNFDWQFSPAVLLFTHPPQGYASVSMVDIAYLGFTGPGAAGIGSLPLEARAALLSAPYLPFDGMNETGLTVSMAAVNPGNMPVDPQKPTVDSLVIIRLVLDGASSVDEAVEIFKQYNLDYGSGPPLHYLVADSSGRAVVIEFYQGKMYVLPNEDTPWHAATNFLLAEPQATRADYPCWRYDRVTQALAENEGRLSVEQAMDLLSSVSQEGGNPTQWSVVYDMTARRVHVVMGRDYGNVYSFQLESGE